MFRYAPSAPRARRTAASPRDADALVCECIRKHLETFLSEDIMSAVIDMIISSHSCTGVPIKQEQPSKQ